MSQIINLPKTTYKNKHELFEQVFQAILESGEDGVFQTEICKEFSLDSRDGSRLAGNLEKQSLISREKILHKGRWTYKLIVKKSAIAEYNKKPIQIECVEGAPCFSCAYQHSCSSEDEGSPYSPAKCVWLEEWIVAGFEKGYVKNEK
ncbi:MAG TPA: transcriptional regulator [Nitrososphaeraceae archaeon]|nr:transcriptional regulator [Nitrososphaeraceae archaeon]